MIWPIAVAVYFARCFGLRLWLEHREHCAHNRRLPDAPGVFTPAQVECLFKMKAQYGAKLDDLPDTNSDDDYTQMTAW